MIIQATRLEGYNYIASPTLSTIGKLFTYYDYRNGVSLSPFAGFTDRVINWSDLSDNNYALNNGGNLTQSSKIEVDGIGDSGSTATRLETVATTQEIGKLHTDNPFLLFAVVRLNTLDGNTINLLTTQRNLTQASFRAVIDFSSDRLLIQWRNDAGALVKSGSTLNSVLPTSNFVLIQLVYKGVSAGANNLEYYIADYTETDTITAGTFGTLNTPAYLSVLGASGTTDFNAKMQACWDLSGKTPAEIDAFRLLAINTLKLDPEYSALTTI